MTRGGAVTLGRGAFCTVVWGGDIDMDMENDGFRCGGDITMGEREREREGDSEPDLAGDWLP